MKVNEGTEDEILVHGYHRNKFRTALYVILCVLTGGLLWIVLRWFPEKRARFTHDACALEEADIVILYTSCDVKKSHVEDVIEIIFDDIASKTPLVHREADIAKNRKFRYFEHMFLRYCIASNNQIFEISGHDQLLNKTDITNFAEQGVSTDAMVFRHTFHGSNLIDIPVRSFLVYALQEAANPFYMFQLFSFTLWFIEEYIIYPVVIIVISLMSITVAAYHTRKQMFKLRAMVGKPQLVRCLDESNQMVEKWSLDLVPGDILLVPRDGLEMPCDAILLENSCVVNESSLTGESFPVSKKPFTDIECDDDTCFDVNQMKAHTLQYGTRVIQANCRHSDEKHVRALVVRTGFCTLKGRLIRNIVYPKAIKFLFFREAYRFLVFLACLGGIGFIYTFIVLYKQGDITIGELFFNSLDIITIIVPPGLPACLSVGIVFALRKLKDSSIFCIDSQRINVCGDLNIFVFDKTGTLTEDHLQIGGVYEWKDSLFQPLEASGSGSGSSQLTKALASCHGLSLIDGKESGNPVDIGMFEFSGWKISSPSQSPYQVVSPPHGENADETIRIIKEFPFESSLQRMSVITKKENEESDLVTVYTKGSPEKILSFCKSGSISPEIYTFLKKETDMGHRVIGIASKVIFDVTDIQNLPRPTVDLDLDFIGLVVFENAIKPASSTSIETLKYGGVRSIMATGDNLNTAASVARDVNIIEDNQTVYELRVENGRLISNTINEKTKQSISLNSPKSEKATTTSIAIEQGQLNSTSSVTDLGYCCVLTGPTYSEIKENLPQLLPKVLVSANVYARMSPIEKTSLIEDLKMIGYRVGMCGDGANDCGALRAADAGIALSEAEASVAAPFTSKIFDISCVPALVREGRAALVTSFSVFKCIAMYSFIQFFGILILYSAKSKYSDWSFFVADLILAFILALAMIQSRTSQQMARRSPPSRLSDHKTIANIFSQLAVMLLFQVVAFVLSRKLNEFYVPPSELGELKFGSYRVSYESYAVVSVSFFQYIWATPVCHTGEPYLAPLYRNWFFVAVFIADCVLIVFTTLTPFDFVASILEFPVRIPKRLALVLLVAAAANLIVLVVIDLLAKKYECFNGCNAKCGNNSNNNEDTKETYKTIYKDLIPDGCLTNKNWF